MVAGLVSALARYGGVITAPRRTVEGLRPGVGERDGLVLGLLYVLATGTFALVESLAGIVATRDLNAFLMLASTVGRLAIAPVVLLVAAETLLGKGRTHRRGLALVPLVAAAAIGLGLIWWVRPHVDLVKEEAR